MSELHSIKDILEIIYYSIFALGALFPLMFIIFKIYDVEYETISGTKKFRLIMKYIILIMFISILIFIRFVFVISIDMFDMEPIDMGLYGNFISLTLQIMFVPLIYKAKKLMDQGVRDRKSNKLEYGNYNLDNSRKRIKHLIVIVLASIIITYIVAVISVNYLLLYPTLMLIFLYLFSLMQECTDDGAIIAKIYEFEYKETLKITKGYILEITEDIYRVHNLENFETEIYPRDKIKIKLRKDLEYKVEKIPNGRKLITTYTKKEIDQKIKTIKANLENLKL